MNLNIIFLKLSSHFPGANELMVEWPMCPVIMCQSSWPWPCMPRVGHMEEKTHLHLQANCEELLDLGPIPRSCYPLVIVTLVTDKDFLLEDNLIVSDIFMFQYFYLMKTSLWNSSGTKIKMLYMHVQYIKILSWFDFCIFLFLFWFEQGKW